MELVIDAQVIKGYFVETVLEQQHFLTGRPRDVCDRLGRADTVFLDKGGHIEHEWRSLVEPEWFEAWYARLLMDGSAAIVPVETCHDLRRRLVRLGFPPNGGDIWYIRTAKAAFGRSGQAFIVTEDLDFYDPSAKESAAAHRDRLLACSGGPVAAFLRRRAQINVCCVARYCELAADSDSQEAKVTGSGPLVSIATRKVAEDGWDG